jgi:site-specific recombinase XerD
MGTRTLSVRVAGPLARYAAGFTDELRARGYTEVSALHHHVRLLAKLSRWLEQAGMEPHHLTALEVDRFLRSRREAAPTGPRTERALAPLLAYLRRLGVVPPAVGAPPEGPVERLLERYRDHLVRERGVVATTVVGYVGVARLFLSGRAAGGRLDLGGLRAAAVRAFVLQESERRGVGSAAYLVTALRALLRFLHLEGEAPALADAVPAVAGWRDASLPRALDPTLVVRLLDSCDRGTADGRRDYAVLTLLVRLGLRAGEVATLELGDVDWRRGEVVVRGKGDRREPLPLPVDVGEAISAYVLGGRPRRPCRRLFLRARAPLDGELTSSAVKGIVRKACRRAGVAPVGAHRLRHTAATAMLRAGASLAEVGQVLRHRSAATTAIYAKVDRAALRAVARPWPGGAA